MQQSIDHQPTGRRIHSGEWTAAAWSFFAFFCVLAAYYMLRPVREQLSAAVGSTQLPWFFGASFGAMLVLTPLFAWMVSRWPRRVVVPLVYLFFIGCLVGFLPLFANADALGPRTLGIVFFVWLSVFNLFVVSVFWTFMADIWNAEQARRLFPLIGIGGVAGAIAGPSLTRGLVSAIGVPSLLLVSAGLLGLALVCVLVLGRWVQMHGAKGSQAKTGAALGGGMFDGLKQIVADPFMRGMALLMVLGDAIGTVAYALLADYSGATFDNAVDRTRFAASIDLATNTLQIVVQLTLTRWLLVRSGAGPVIAGWAVAGIAVCLAMALSGDPYATAVTVPLAGAFPWVALVMIVTRGLAYGMVQPARESLYTRVPRELRYKGKNAVDTAVWRAGDVISALSINGLRAAGVTIGGFGLVGALALASAGVIGLRLARRVERGDDARRRAETASASR
jgi:AAA family ATP:ADP antiporter